MSINRALKARAAEFDGTASASRVLPHAAEFDGTASAPLVLPQ
jgi:hypothetical protein